MTGEWKDRTASGSISIGETALAFDWEGVASIGQTLAIPALLTRAGIPDPAYRQGLTAQYGRYLGQSRRPSAGTGAKGTFGARTTAPSGSHVSAAGISAGSGVIRNTSTFDFDAGIETAHERTADVLWLKDFVTQEDPTHLFSQMEPLNGAALCAMGLVAFDPLSWSDLQHLPYSTIPIPANVSRTNLLPDGSVFAVRTRTGNFVKVQVLHYDYDLQIRWQTCTRPIHFLDVKITLGSTPAWLVSKYVDLSIQIDGRFQDQALPIFAQTYDLADKAVLIRAQKSTTKPGYVLVSV